MANGKHSIVESFAKLYANAGQSYDPHKFAVALRRLADGLENKSKCDKIVMKRFDIHTTTKVAEWPSASITIEFTEFDLANRNWQK
jgi:hypothetical protein